MRKAQGKLKHPVLMALAGLLVACTVHGGQESPLQAALIHKSDFLSNWRWTGESNRVERGFDTGAEGAYQILSGLYSSERHYVKVMHLLLRYDQPVSCETIGISDDASFPIEGEDFSVETVVVGQCVKSKRVRETKGKSSSTMVCQVSVDYDYVTSGWTIYGPGNMSNQDVETIINEALTGTDARIKKIDNLPEE